MKTTNLIVFMLILLNIIPGKLTGQSYSIFPDDTISTTGIMEDLATLTIQQINTTSGTIQLQWQKVSESVPANWEASVCDNLLCYTSLVDSGMMNPVPPSNYGFLLMHITAHVNYGTVTIRYAVWDVVNPGMKDTLTFIHTVNAPTGINTLNFSQFEIYPTIVNDKINVKSNNKMPLNYFISNVNGQVAKYGTINNGNGEIECDGLSDGIYVVSVYDNNTSKREQIIIQH